MIVHAASADNTKIAEIAEQDPLLGLHILARLQVYGCGTPAADFWYLHQTNNIHVVICRDNATVCISSNAPNQLDCGELRSFLGVLGGFHTVMAEAGLCARLFPSEPLQSAPIMQYADQVLPCRFPNIRESIPLSCLYSLLFPETPFIGTDAQMHWYTYHSHLFRHQLGCAAAIWEDGVPVSTGGIYAQSRSAGLIACVATHSRYRNRGYARQLVQYLCSRIQTEGKRPVLYCADDALAAFYASLGFVPIGRWGQLHFSIGCEFG